MALQKGDMEKVSIGIMLDSRSIPYPPSFSNSPAKIIDPETGASTCAFGNHKWKKYIGIFTKKASIDIIHHSLVNLGIVKDKIVKSIKNVIEPNK